MSDHLPQFLHLIGFASIAVYLAGIVLWLRMRYLKDRYTVAEQEREKEAIAAARLRKMCDQYRFENEWLHATARGQHSGKHLLEVLKRWSDQPTRFYGWILYQNNEWDATHREFFPEAALKRFSYVSSHLTLNRKVTPEVFEELPAGIENLTLFRSQQQGSETCIIVVSQIPGCFSKKNDFEQLAGYMKYAQCLSRSVPQKLIHREDDLESVIVKEMLEIRSLLDIEFQSPQELMQSFLHKLTTLTGYSFASLYLCDESGLVQGAYSHFASGGKLGANENQAQWQAAEKIFIQSVSSQLDESLILTSETLHEREEEIPFRCGMIMPVKQDGTLVGVLMLTHTDETLPSDEGAQLVEWASQFLMKTLNREVTRIESIDQARRDGLTQLANRRAFDEELNRFVERARLSPEACSLIMVDLDHFKAINDKYGHQAGDEVLLGVANVMKLLTQNLRVSDYALAARYGGEEFALILPNVGLQGALRIGEQLRQKIADLEFTFNHQKLNITASLGVAATSMHGNNAGELLRAADDALYIAKNTGRNKVKTMHQKTLPQNANADSQEFLSQTAII